MIEKLSFLQGAWTCPKWEGTFEEQWGAPSGGVVQGFGRHLREGQAHFIEFMIVEPDGNDLWMRMLLRGSNGRDYRQIALRCVELSEGHAVFEDERSEFPRRITYETREGGKLWCLLQGTEKSRKPDEEFDFEPIPAN